MLVWGGGRPLHSSTLIWRLTRYVLSVCVVWLFHLPLSVCLHSLLFISFEINQWVMHLMKDYRMKLRCSTLFLIYLNKPEIKPKVNSATRSTDSIRNRKKQNCTKIILKFTPSDCKIMLKWIYAQNGADSQVLISQALVETTEVSGKTPQRGTKLKPNVICAHIKAFKTQLVVLNKSQLVLKLLLKFILFLIS